MKILILTNNDIGLYKFRKELIEALLKNNTSCGNEGRGYNEVYISTPYGQNVAIFQKMGCKYVESPIDRRGKNLVKDFKLILHYFYIIKNIKPDVVLTYTIKPTIYGVMICRIKHIPYIDNITCLVTEIESEKLYSRLLFKLYKFGINKADSVFFQNKSNKDLFKSKSIAINNSALINGSGVNLDEFLFEKYPPKQFNEKYLFIGRIMKEKGISEFLDCAENIKKKYSNVIFYIIGDYEDITYKPRIDKLVSEKIVEYLGYQENVHSFMKECNAVILPTYHEGMSNVLLESAATGRPVIASKIPGCEEIFKEGSTGIGIKPKDSYSLINATEYFLKLPYNYKKKMGYEARKHVEENFNRKLIVERYLKEIDRILS